KALQSAGLIAGLQGDNAVGRARLEESVAIWRLLGDEHGLAEALHFLGHVTFDHSDLAVARSLFEEAEAMFEAMGDKVNSVLLVGDLGLIAYHEGRYAEAQSILEELIPRLQQLDLKGHVGIMLNRL